MRAKIIFAVPKPPVLHPTITDAFTVFYYKKINVKNYREARDRIIKVWNTNKKLREKVREFHRQYYPLARHMVAHVGIGTSYINPFREMGTSIPIFADKIQFNLYGTKVEEIE